MAVIFDAVLLNKVRFTKWAEGYLSVPEQMYEGGVILHEDVILAYLIEKGVFTIEELKKELSENKIHFNEYAIKKELERNKTNR